MGQYSKFQKTYLVFHTFSRGSGTFFFVFPGEGHSSQFFNNLYIFLHRYTYVEDLDAQPYH